MARSNIVRSIESELSSVRNFAEHAHESVLLYLIDMAILEVQSVFTYG